MTDDMSAILSRLERLNTIPWRYLSLGYAEAALVVDKFDHSIIVRTDNHETACLDQFDAEFIAHAPADIRALLDQHDADQQRIADLEAALRAIRDKPPVVTTNSDKTFARGFNRATAECRAIARRALGGE